MYKKIIIGLTAIFFIISVVIVSPGYAGEGLPYLVEPIFPENQDDGVEQYISITPNSNSLKQELEFLVTNKTDKKQKINIKVFNAYTSPSGIIQYQETEDENSVIIDDAYQLRNYVDAPNNVVLEGGQSKKVKVNINVPGMDGTVLGAIAFQGEGKSDEERQKGISFQIRNEINTVHGVVLHFSTKKETDFSIGDPFVEPMPSYYGVRLPITLNSPLLLEEINLEYDVLLEGKTLFFSKEEIKFAPMTKTNFMIPWEKDEIEKGKTYTLKGKLTYRDQNGNEQTEAFEKEFSLEDEALEVAEAKVLNTPDITGPFWGWWLLSLIPLILLLMYMLKKSDRQYVLYSGNADAVLILEEGHELFTKVKPKREAKNTDNLPYAHYYRKRRNSEGRIVYEHRKTKTK